MTAYPFLTQLSPAHRRPAAWRRRWLIMSLVIVLCMLLTGCRSRYNQTDVLTQTVDTVRDIIGPRPVAIIEGTVFWVEDWFNRLNYQLTGNKSSGWNLVARTESAAGSSAASASDQAQPVKTQGRWTFGLTPPMATTVPFSPPAPLPPLITDGALPAEGQWQPLGTAGQPAGQPSILWATTFRPDPSRPFAEVGLVAMDLSRSRLHLMIGTVEPTSRNSQAPRPGMIPLEVQTGGSLLAAWNGGFKAVHGHYGMMSAGVTWLPPIPGMATLGIERDGRVVIGAWGREVTPSLDLIAWRQNNPPLIENGAVNPDIHNIIDTAAWGPTVTKKAYTWRSGLGLTQDGHWLIYAAGNSLTTETLTEALQAAGAYNAMQTDINGAYDRFETYAAARQHVLLLSGQVVTLSLKAQRLIDQMKGDSTQFLIPYKRDFFYLTALSTPTKQTLPQS